MQLPKTFQVQVFLATLILIVRKTTALTSKFQVLNLGHLPGPSLDFIYEPRTNISVYCQNLFVQVLCQTPSPYIDNGK